MKDLLLVITGASRGLGRAIALQAAKQNESFKSIDMILVARNEADLQDTAEQVKGTAGSNVTTRTLSMDLSDVEDLQEVLEIRFIPMIEDSDTMKDPEQTKLIFINNAGSLGHIGSCTAIPYLQDMQMTFDFNITSALWLSTRMTKFIKRRQPDLEGTIVNISSLVAVQPFPSMALYSAGKAARDMFHAATAFEEPTIKFLNYAPGPLETDMTTEIREAPQLHKTLQPHYAKKLIEPNDSASKLIQLLISDDFKSGAHIDYYDV